MSKIALVVLVDSDDPRLAPSGGRSATADCAMWQAAIDVQAMLDVFPASKLSVLAVLPEDEAAMMLFAHQIAVQALPRSSDRRH